MYSNWKFARTTYPVSCLISTGLLLTMSIGSQAYEPKPSDRQQPHISLFSTQPLFLHSIINGKASRQKEKKRTLTIAQQLPKRNGSLPIDGNKSLAQKLEEFPNSAQAHPHQFYIGPDLFYRDYKEEEIRPGFKSNEFGTLYGVQATYDYVKGNSIYGGGSFRYGGGKTAYEGGIQINGTQNDLKSTTDNKFLNAEGRLGYTFSLDRQDRLLVSPFVGVGYHQWNRDVASSLSSNGTRFAGVIEDYSWGYLGPGVQAKYQVSPQFDIGLDAKLMMMVDGKIEATIKNPATGQVTSTDGGKLGNALQYEVELPITYHLTQDNNSNIDLKLAPYYRSQDIARGPLFRSGTAREPASKTSVYGVTLGAQFNF
jgi:hypothetical protein